MTTIITISIPEDLNTKVKQEENVSEFISALISKHYTEKESLGFDEVEVKFFQNNKNLLIMDKKKAYNKIMDKNLTSSEILERQTLILDSIKKHDN